MRVKSIITGAAAAALVVVGVPTLAHAETSDTVKPVASLSAPSTATFDSSTTGLVISATDDIGLAKVVANIYQDGALLVSTQSAAGGATSFDHTVDLAALRTVGLLPLGDYSVKYNAVDAAGNLSKTTTFAFTIVDKVKPIATLVTPTAASSTSGTIAIQVDATDARGLNRVVANVYKDGTLVKSTQSAAGGATSATHTASVTLPDGSYSIKYNASDLTGNIASTGTFAFVIDTTKPTVTLKDGALPGLKSFKLYDAGKIDKLTLNGVEKNLTDNAWSDLNNVKPGVFGRVEGANTLVVYDVAGNTTTVEFVLDTIVPTVVAQSSEYQTKEGGRIAVTLTFSEPIAAAPGQGWYGSGTTFTKVYYSEKTHTIAFSDAAGNAGSYTFTVPPVQP